MKGLLKRLLKAAGKAILSALADVAIEGRKAGRWDTRPAPPSDRTMDPR